MTANGVGAEPQTRTVTVRDDEVTTADFDLAPVTLFAGSGRALPGPRSEGEPTDIALENALLGVVVSASSQDGQLAPVTPGKPRDLAAAGFQDQLDWINLPYAALDRPHGTEAWRSRTVRAERVEVTGSGVVQASGASTEVPGLAVTTTYTCAKAKPGSTPNRPSPTPARSHAPSGSAT